MLLRLYNDDSPLQDHSKDRFLSDAPLPPDPVIDSDIEAAAAVAERDQSITTAAAADEEDDEDLEEGGVAVNPLAEKGTTTRPPGSDTAMSNYGTSMGTDNPAA